MSKRILVVDDDQSLRRLLQDALEDEGHEVDQAVDGLATLEKLDQQCCVYDIILLDMNMPRMDGLQFLQTIHKRAVFSSIIVLSGDDQALRQAVRMGVHHTLSKPFDLDILLTLVAAPCPESEPALLADHLRS